MNLHNDDGHIVVSRRASGERLGTRNQHVSTLDHSELTTIPRRRNDLLLSNSSSAAFIDSLTPSVKSTIRSPCCSSIDPCS